MEDVQESGFHTEVYMLKSISWNALGGLVVGALVGLAVVLVSQVVSWAADQTSIVVPIIIVACTSYLISILIERSLSRGRLRSYNTIRCFAGGAAMGGLALSLLGFETTLWVLLGCMVGGALAGTVVETERTHHVL